MFVNEDKVTQLVNAIQMDSRYYNRRKTATAYMFRKYTFNGVSVAMNVVAESAQALRTELNPFEVIAALNELLKRDYMTALENEAAGHAREP